MRLLKWLVADYSPLLHERVVGREDFWTRLGRVRGGRLAKIPRPPQHQHRATKIHFKISLSLAVGLSDDSSDSSEGVLRRLRFLGRCMRYLFYVDSTSASNTLSCNSVVMSMKWPLTSFCLPDCRSFLLFNIASFSLLVLRGIVTSAVRCSFVSTRSIA